MRLFPFLALSLALLTGPAAASDKREIAEAMAGYWTAYSSGDYRTAAGYVDPRDIAELRRTLLPVFIAAAKVGNAETVAMTNLLFKDVPLDDRPLLSAVEVFDRFNRMLSRIVPRVFDALRESAIGIGDIEVTAPGEATLSYLITVPGGEDQETDRFSKHEGKWYLRLKEPPGTTAAQFEEMFARNR